MCKQLICKLCALKFPNNKKLKKHVKASRCEFQILIGKGISPIKHKEEPILSTPCNLFAMSGVRTRAQKKNRFVFNLNKLNNSEDKEFLDFWKIKAK